MGSLLFWTVVLVTLVCVFYVIYMLSQDKQSQKASSGGEQQPPPYDEWQPGTLVNILGHGDMIVRKIWRFNMNQWTWTEYECEANVWNAPPPVHLCVERENGDWVFTLYREKVSVPKDFNSGDPNATLEVNGITWELEEHGSRVDYKLEMLNEQSVISGQMRYADYKAADGRLLSIEDYGNGEVEAWLGQEISQKYVRWLGQSDVLAA